MDIKVSPTDSSSLLVVILLLPLPACLPACLPKPIPPWDNYAQPRELVGWVLVIRSYKLFSVCQAPRSTQLQVGKYH